MGEVKPEPVVDVWPTVNPSISGGASGLLTTCFFQPIDTTKLFADVNQVSVTENIEVVQSTIEKSTRGDKWDFQEDMALMSAWCVASEHQFHFGKKKRTSLWAQVRKLYDEEQAENSEKLRPKNENQIKGRWKRLNGNAIKWIDAYRKAYKLKTSEMSSKDIENEAHKIYAESGGVSMYSDIIVFNEVMCKHRKWELLNDCDTTPEYEMGNEESGSSTKRTMTTEEGD